MRNLYTFKHNLSDAQIDDLFIQEMSSRGLLFVGSDLPLKVNGKTHYVRCTGRSKKNKNSRSGWYCAHYGEFPIVKFGWFHGDKAVFEFRIYDYLKEKGGGQFIEVSPEEAKLREFARKEQERLQQIELAKQRELSHALTVVEWMRAKPLDHLHPYLIKKKFSLNECQGSAKIYNRSNYTGKELQEILAAHLPSCNTRKHIHALIEYQTENISYRGNNLLIKGQTFTEDHVMFQLIFDKKAKSGKDKHFPKGSAKHGSFTIIGPQNLERLTTLIICEGWATGISLHRFVPDIPIAVAWDSGNMVAVATECRRRFPLCKIISANDNDHTETEDKNAGMLGGIKTCNLVGAYIVEPPFNSDDENQKDWSDWNDIDLNHDLAQASSLFHQQLDNAIFMPAEYDASALFLAFEKFESNKREIIYEHQIINSNDLSKFALINCLGLHHCFEVFDEYLSTFTKTFHLINFTDSREISDTYINAELALQQALYQFALTLEFSDTPLMSQMDAFIEVVQSVQTASKFIDNPTSMLLVKRIVANKFSDDLAIACICNTYNQLKLFRSKQEFRLAILSMLATHDFALEIDQDILFTLLFDLKESDYWQFVNASDRLQAALRSCLSVFEKLDLPKNRIEACE